MDDSKESQDNERIKPAELSLVGQDWDSDVGDEIEEDETGISLEELSQTYAKVLNRTDSATNFSSADKISNDAIAGTLNKLDGALEELTATESGQVTPESILEAILFVGRPDNIPITPEEAASVMRGVQPSEIEWHVVELNSRYAATGRAMRIASYGAGYRMQLADDLQYVRDRFYGPARQVKLNQAAIDCLALVAYQPGITREQLEDQRNQPCGTILNQLVRRQLIEIRRQGPKNREVHYYPTNKLVQLMGLDSIEDLPQVEGDS